ncbi:MAG: hypothetical protein EBZ77_06885 [Chitinophagia bacterium]|nr:hypothetical protein [Chitinophagia bacterium]
MSEVKLTDWKKITDILSKAESEIYVHTGTMVDITVKIVDKGALALEGQNLLRLVADTLRIDYAMYSRRCRRRDVVDMRMIAAHLLCTLMNHTNSTAAELIGGGLKQCTISWYNTQVKTLLSVRHNNSDFAEKYDQCRAAVKNWLQTKIN